MKRPYNINAVLGSLLTCLQDHRFVLVSVDDELQDYKLFGTPRQRRQQAKQLIRSTVVSKLFVSHPDYGSEELLLIDIVLAERPSMLVPMNSDFLQLNLALDQFRRKWRS